MKPHLAIVYAVIVLVSAFLGCAFFFFRGEPPAEAVRPVHPVAPAPSEKQEAARRILREHADFQMPPVPMDQRGTEPTNAHR